MTHKGTFLRNKCSHPIISLQLGFVWFEIYEAGKTALEICENAATDAAAGQPEVTGIYGL